ncbi:NAD-dependent epimerase/dehydratase family protein [Candidatus Wolfebacteria bacterium]|nr:NAD-dependent epimerase/dehydratase family protein [Candidatus Wolfebacteria bacterium]
MKLNKNLKIGITGSKGFIGGHIVAGLENQGVKLSFFDLPKNNLLKPNPNLLKKFILRNDIIIHAAAINRGMDIEVIAGSVVATYNLISAMEKCGSKAKLIFLSSIQAETETLYGKSKRLAEIMLEDFSNRIKSPVSIFRLTNIFGEWGKPFYNSVIATFCHQVAKGEKLNVNPNDKKIKFLYVGDFVKIIIKELTLERKNNFYLKTISSSNEISIPDLANLIESFKKNKFKAKNKFYKDLYKTYLSYQYKSV